MSMPQTLPPDLVEALNTAAGAAVDQSAGTPGAVVGVRTDTGTWLGTFGTADPSTGKANTRDTHFRIGSVTKMFTATLLLQMVESGGLTLADPIADYVPAVPGGDQITLDLLARMRSGLANYTSVPEVAALIVADPAAPQEPDAMIRLGLSHSPVFAPDERFDYCNTNYLLLGRVIEQVADSDFGSLLSEHILKPLGLTGTWWPGDSAELPHPFARGFTLLVPSGTPGEPVDATDFNPSWGGAAGSLVSTADDLLAFSSILATGNGLLGAGTQALRLDSFAPAPSMGPGVSYGLGLMQIDGWIGHSGDIPGYRAACYYHPDISTSVVVLTASDIVAGRCPEASAAVTMASDAECMSPTARIFDAVSKVLGRPSSTPTGGAS
ncbi:MAG: serine hydrolase domain-containing protein [Candidatus Nanopelagicales bacterium]